MWCDIYDPDHAILKDLADELNLNIVGGRGRDRRRRTHQGHRLPHAHLLHGLRGHGQGTRRPPTTPTSTLVKHRISAFVLPRGLITVRLSPRGDDPFDMDEVSQRFDELGGQEYGVGALVHGLLDVVVDGHFDAVQALDDEIEGLEDELFDDDGPERGLQRRTFRLRKDLVELRRVVLPMREVVNADPAPPAGRQDRAGARPALRRPVRPRAARRRSGRSRCATWSRRCSRRTCRCRTPA